MKRPDLILCAILGGLILGLVVLFVWAWRESERRDVTPFRDEMMVKMMRRKQETSDGIEKALRQSRFRAVEAGVERLRELAVVADWYVEKEAYRVHSNDFRVALDRLDQSAQQRDLTAATTAYRQLQASCVDCHDLTGRFASGRRNR